MRVRVRVGVSVRIRVVASARARVRVSVRVVPLQPLSGGARAAVEPGPGPPVLSVREVASGLAVIIINCRCKSKS